jgi:transcriptional regulator with XRE-family HTH domain
VTLLEDAARIFTRIPEGKVSEVARRSGVSRRMLSRLRTGTIGDMKVSTLIRIMDVLGIDVLLRRHVRAMRRSPQERRSLRTRRVGVSSRP